MSFNRRGGPDRRPDRPPRREGYGDRGGGRGHPPRDRPPRDAGDRPYGGRGERGPGPRRYDRSPDDGGMSIRLDPRRLGVLKRLAGEAGLRPGDLVREWVEERIDATRPGEGGVSLEQRVRALEERIDALAVPGSAAPAHARPAQPEPRRPSAEAPPEPQPSELSAPEAEAAAPTEAVETAEPAPPGSEAPEAAPLERRRRRVSASPSGRVALHDEMIAVLAERGPMTAGDLAAAIVERGRYAPPRSGKPLDAAMVSQRASNPTYRSRFTRREGRIGLAEDAE